MKYNSGEIIYYSSVIFSSFLITTVIGYGWRMDKEMWKARQGEVDKEKRKKALELELEGVYKK